MDRVKVAVSILHYNVAKADRNAAFRAGYARLVVAQFGSGLSEELRSKVFGVPNPPATIAGVLAAITAAEAERKPCWNEVSNRSSRSRRRSLEE